MSMYTVLGHVRYSVGRVMSDRVIWACVDTSQGL